MTRRRGKGRPVEPQGWRWPEEGCCRWPTSEGLPWTFCGAPVAPGGTVLTAGYCAEHAARTHGRAAGAAGNQVPGAIAGQDLSLPRPGGFRLPPQRETPSGRALLNAARSSAASRARNGKAAG